jgi:hypothetical protein
LSRGGWQRRWRCRRWRNGWRQIGRSQRRLAGRHCRWRWRGDGEWHRHACCDIHCSHSDDGGAESSAEGGERLRHKGLGGRCECGAVSVAIRRLRDDEGDGKAHTGGGERDLQDARRLEATQRGPEARCQTRTLQRSKSADVPCDSETERHHGRWHLQDDFAGRQRPKRWECWRGYRWRWRGWWWRRRWRGRRRGWR